MFKKITNTFISKGEAPVESLALPFEGEDAPVGCTVLDEAVKGGWDYVYIESKGVCGEITLMKGHREERLLATIQNDVVQRYIKFISGGDVDATGVNGVTTETSHVIYDYEVYTAGRGMGVRLKLLCSEPRFVFDKTVDNPPHFDDEAYDDLYEGGLSEAVKVKGLGLLDSLVERGEKHYSLALRSIDSDLDGGRAMTIDPIEPKREFMQLLSGYLRDWIFYIGTEKHIEHNVLVQTEDHVLLLPENSATNATS